MMDKKFICEKAIGHYGEESRIVNACKELLKLECCINEKMKSSELKEQIAKTMVALDQVEIMKGISAKELEDEINFQYLRLNDNVNCYD